MAKDPQTVAQMYRSGIAGAGAKYQAGVTAAASDWETAAKSDAAEAAYRAGVERATQTKKRQKALGPVTGGDWARAAQEVGAPNYTRAADRAAQGYERVVGDVLSAGDSAKAAARAIPGVTMADRLQRGPAAAIAIHRYWARKMGVNPEV